MTPVLAVGGPAAVADFAALMISDLHAGMSVVGACVPARPAGFDEADAHRLDELGIPLLGDVDLIVGAVGACGARNVAVLAGEIDGEKLRWIAWQLEGFETGLIVSPGLAEVGGRRLHIQPVLGLPLLYVDEPRFPGFNCLLKGGLDRIAAGLALLILLPFSAAIAVRTRLTSSGPALFRQTRVGLNGKRFTTFQFRPMRRGAESGIAELIANDDLGSGPLVKMREHPDASVLLCAGKGVSRARIANRANLDDSRYATVVHPDAQISLPSTLGRGCLLLAGTMLTAPVTLGKHVVVMPNVTLCHDDAIADFATICAGVTLGGGVCVGERAYLGMAVGVREGVVIGDDSVVGMGSAVLQDVPPGHVVGGVPARQLIPSDRRATSNG